MIRSVLLFAGILLGTSSFSATIHTFAGTGKAGFSGDGGPATKAQINNPFGVVRGPDGEIYFCTYSGQRIRKVTADGEIHTIAGNGETGYIGDGGPALQASLNKPHEIRFDKNGDEKLTKDEVEGRIKERFDEFDTDKDGNITSEEFNARMESRTSGNRGATNSASQRPPFEDQTKKP